MTSFAAKSCAEQLLNPQATAVKGVLQEILGIIDDAEITIRDCLVKNILLNGAASQTKGLDARLVSEIKPLWNNVRVVNKVNPAILAWFGGSILGSLSTAEYEYITAKEY